MKLLKDILYKTGIIETLGNTEREISGIAFDSRKVEKGSLFVAVKGTKADGHEFIEQTEKSGAVAIVCEKFPEKISDEITYIKVADSSYALGWIAANYYDNPSEKLNVIGITGTNGKTTTATLLHQLFIELGYKAGLFSTVCLKINDTVLPATHTTPDAIQIQSILKDMADKGCTYCFMEVSSHAIVQHRITGIDFAGGVFTNITHDHLDFHKTFEEYLHAKKTFFDTLGSKAFALSNTDDKNGKVMLQNSKAANYTYALKNVADYKAKIIENRFTGLQLNIDGIDVWFKLVGSFNAYNLLGIYATACLLGLDKSEVLTVLSRLTAVEGRFETVFAKDKTVAIVDYAHTPDALENVLKTIAAVKDDDSNVITVVGCGGDRDKTKRPVMANIACKLSDKVIITSDNPRSEDPEKIIEDMLAGVDITDRRKVVVVADRREAIRTACHLTSPHDIILIAGKGHEKYQDIKGVKHPFDDLKVVNEIFEQLK
ncbi:MAG TPA: UDP-N-acetylmuramoyl-L-alanyl-D-glutamate--2,6-diaminopimelate ligase [Bacteroidales bacterium]|nr:UDP-N-acetylmuramoyl-L-alanyl-D-glutamate--2,6-diaminopimelate ligase [Bacteroidales bacterium]HPS16395.1 UDP-N-acetylmuramoyl-L-alanyl-D-glutamate--2,6-diaminopimelate ligase [Bacteroidales bacterium]